jgi:hypothetical protein
MGFPTSAVGYTSATAGRGDHEVHKGHAVALERKKEHLDKQRCPEVFNSGVKGLKYIKPVFFTTFHSFLGENLYTSPS